MAKTFFQMCRLCKLFPMEFILFAVGIIFAAGAAYSAIMKIPSLENRIGTLEVQQSAVIQEVHDLHVYFNPPVVPLPPIAVKK